MSRSHERGQQHLATPRTRGLILGCVFVAAVLNGMLASGINRTLVDMPAWQHVGAPAWAEFSRWADMGTNGLILYPLEGIGGAVLSIGAAVVFHRSRGSMTRSAAVPIYAAALLALGGMLATTQAAPTLLGTQHLSDPVALQQALNRFEFWGGVRAVFQSLAPAEHSYQPHQWNAHLHIAESNFLTNVVLVPKGESLLLVEDDSVEHIIQNGIWTPSGLPQPQTEPGAPIVHSLDIKGGSVHIGPFPTAGVFHLYCTIHQGMSLTVVVQ